MMTPVLLSSPSLLLAAVLAAAAVPPPPGIAVALEAHARNEPLQDRVKRAKMVGQPDIDFVLTRCDKVGSPDRTL